MIAQHTLNAYYCFFQDNLAADDCS